MSLAIAWGSVTDPWGYPAKYPRSQPFLPGTQGALLHSQFPEDTSYGTNFSEGYVAFGLTEPPGAARVNISITFAPIDGSPEFYHSEPFDLHAGNDNASIQVYLPSGLIGSYKIVASIDGVPLPTSLILTTLGGELKAGMYGEIAWHEESIEVPSGAFWTWHIRTREII